MFMDKWPHNGYRFPKKKWRYVMKKTLLSAILVLTLVLSISVTAFAATCETCGSSSNTKYCDGYVRTSSTFHPITGGGECYYHRFYYATIYQCNKCSWYWDGSDHLEKSQHEDCGQGTTNYCSLPHW